MGQTLKCISSQKESCASPFAAVVESWLLFCTSVACCIVIGRSNCVGYSVCVSTSLCVDCSCPVLRAHGSQTTHMYILTFPHTHKQRLLSAFLMLFLTKQVLLPVIPGALAAFFSPSAKISLVNSSRGDLKHNCNTHLTWWCVCVRVDCVCVCVYRYYTTMAHEVTCFSM